MAARLLVIAEQWDQAAANQDALKAAGMEFSRLIEQVRMSDVVDLAAAFPPWNCPWLSSKHRTNPSVLLDTLPGRKGRIS